jgi:flagellar basal body P-ring formation protein FlgA
MTARRPAPALRLAVALAVGLVAAPALAQESAVVATRVIYPGQTITAEALDEVSLRRGRKNLGEVALAADQIEGKVARRTLLPGRLIPIASVREPYVVEAGAPVQVVLVEGALTISLSGVPLQPGAVGDFIKVRNMDSGAVFMGVVLADGTVRVGAT